MQTTWKYFLKSRKNNVLFSLSILCLVGTLFAFLHFLTFNENRVGQSLNDPILNWFQPVQVSLIAFVFTYGFALTGIAICIRSPFLFIRLLQCYTLMILIRMACLYLVPLEAPANIIPLEDEFLHSTFYSGRANLKDLFFSGHTATMFLFAFLFENKKQKYLFLFGGIAIGFLVILQHVHYSIDVFAAPIISYGVVALQKKFILVEAIV